MCACELPKADSENAVKAIKAAIDLQQFIKEFGLGNKIQNLPVFEVRIGIDTGPLVAGVVGLKKFAYDIWGDTVNLASQMEQHNEEGKVNISGATYLLVKDYFQCHYRGKIGAKSKGQIDMNFVEGVN